jgi:hypothetical protein
MIAVRAHALKQPRFVSWLRMAPLHEAQAMVLSHIGSRNEK